MKQPSTESDPLRRQVIERAQAINVRILTQLSTVAEDLAQGHHLAALDSLDGLERQINIMRSFLLLIS